MVIKCAAGMGMQLDMTAYRFLVSSELNDCVHQINMIFFPKVIISLSFVSAGQLANFAIVD